MADASFVKRRLEVRITLRAGEFGSGGNTKILTGIPIKAHIEKTGPPDFNKASVEIRGMLYQDMERLSTLAFKPLFNAHNLISVYAGNERDGLSLAFSGEITQASADFNAAPDVSFKIEAMTGYFPAITAAGPSAVNGSQPVADFIGMQARNMGYAFKNEGVTASLSNSIFSGSPLAQARAAANQVGAELLIDDGTVVLLPTGGNREGNAVLLNKDTGMLGYPVISSEGVDVRCLYNERLELGGLIQVESIVPRASGIWRIIKLSHELEAFNPGGGPWESKMTAFYPSRSAPGGNA